MSSSQPVERLRDLMVAVCATSDLAAALALHLDAALAVAGFDCGGVYFVDPESGVIELALARGLGPDFVAAVTHYEPGSGSGLVVAEGKPRYLDRRDIDELPSAAIHCREGLRALAVLPVLHAAKVIALINVAAHADVMLPPERRAVLEALAAHLGSSIARLRAEEELRRGRRELQELSAALARRLVEGAAAQGDALRALAESLHASEQAERRRVRRVVHDHLQQTLVAVRLSIGRMRRVGLGAAEPLARDADRMVGQAIEITRSLTAEIAPPVLFNTGLVRAVEWLCDWMRQSYGLAASVHADGELGDLPEHIRVFVFLALRELLFNVVKHAGVATAEVALRRADAGLLRVEIEDRGRGYDVAMLSGSPGGTLEIRQRLALLGGDWFVDSAPGRGTVVRLAIPVPAGEPQATACGAA